MSKRTIQRQNDERNRKRRTRHLFVTKVAAAVMLLLTLVYLLGPFKAAQTSNQRATSETIRLLTADALAHLNHLQLEALDIATRNFICGKGIVDDNMGEATLYQRIDAMAQRTRAETQRNHHRFQSNPQEYQNSAAYYKMLMLVTVLQQDYGMLYNPQRVTKAGVIEPNSTFFADPRDVFIHGLLQEKRKGTCASLPVLAIAVGRRLGYPLALVSTQNHLFVRWNDTNEKFNIEVTSMGMNTYPDDHYRNWPYPIDQQTEQDNCYLQVMSAAEETAVFFSLRGFCMMAQNRHEDALKAHENAVKLAPKALHYQKILATAKAEVLAKTNPKHAQRAKLPPHPMFQDSKMAPEVNWILWEQHERARIQHQAQERELRQRQSWLPQNNVFPHQQTTPLHQSPIRQSNQHILQP